MNLILKRPIAFLDLEATGLNREKDRIVEIAIVKLFPDGSRVTKTKRINPEMPIPAEATAVHGITDADVADAPTFKLIAKSLHAFIENCDMAGFGSNSYDIPVLYHEFVRAGIMWDYRMVNFIDVGNVYKINEPRDLSAALKFYCGREHEGAHGAEADTIAALDVFLAQTDRYNMPQTVQELALYSNYGRRVLDLSGKFTFNDKNEVIYNFGPHKGKPVKDEPAFLDWMLDKDFPADTVSFILQLQQELSRPKLSPHDSTLPF